MHIPIIEEQGIEADDLIGTLSKKAEKEGFQVFMVTPDKDFAQLVSENIFMYRPSRMGNGIEIWGVDEVKEKFEVTDPLQVIRSEEHTSELQSRPHLVCRLLLEK